VSFRDKIQKMTTSAHEKLQMYNFLQLPTELAKDKSMQNLDNQREDSLCITEENRFQNEINPIKLADLGWVDDYKLEKLLRQ
jgi:hypothetical protein